VYNRAEVVSDLAHLPNFMIDADAEEAWNAFDAAELEGKSYQTRCYKHGKAFREWRAWCDDHGAHPALADPEDIEAHLTEQAAEMDKLATVYTNRFRPLFLWYRWMMCHADFPHRYNPTLMAVLLGGTVYDLWEIRLRDRKNSPLENE
jgi:hypothetical protein